MKKEIIQAQKSLKRARELAARTPSSFHGITMEEAVRKIRKVREELWEEKLAVGARHK